jgi:hypothetical protein
VVVAIVTVKIVVRATVVVMGAVTIDVCAKVVEIGTVTTVVCGKPVVVSGRVKVKSVVSEKVGVVSNIVVVPPPPPYVAARAGRALCARSRPTTGEVVAVLARKARRRSACLPRTSFSSVIPSSLEQTLIPRHGRSTVPRILKT